LAVTPVFSFQPAELEPHESAGVIRRRFAVVAACRARFHAVSFPRG
jgi:hypothetical protein